MEVDVSNRFVVFSTQRCFESADPRNHRKMASSGASAEMITPFARRLVADSTGDMKDLKNDIVLFAADTPNSWKVRQYVQSHQSFISRANYCEPFREF